MSGQTISDVQWLDGLRSRPAPSPPPPPEPGKREKRRLGLTGGLVVAGAVSLLAAPVLGGALTRHPHPAVVKPVRAATVAAPTTATKRAADDALAFRSFADCPEGPSNDARGLANLEHPDPWLCAYHAPGQTLHLTLTGPGGVEHSQVITKFTIIPGVVGPPDAAGKDPWMLHRCVKWIRLQFNDVEHASPIDLDTQCVRGEASVEVPNITASQVTVIVREAIRPPASPTPSQTSKGGGLLSDFVFPTQDFGTAEHGNDPADGTFAVGGVLVSGHEATR